MNTIEFYSISSPSQHYTVTLRDFRHGALPIIWCNRGLYGVVDIHRVQEYIRQLENAENLPATSSIHGYIKMYWDTDVEVPDNRAFKHLFD